MRNIRYYVIDMFILSKLNKKYSSTLANLAACQSKYIFSSLISTIATAAGRQGRRTAGVTKRQKKQNFSNILKSMIVRSIKEHYLYLGHRSYNFNQIVSLSIDRDA